MQTTLTKPAKKPKSRKKVRPKKRSAEEFYEEFRETLIELKEVLAGRMEWRDLEDVLNELNAEDEDRP